MRVNTWTHSAASWEAVKTRCSEWQPTQSGKNDLIRSSPGTLMSHSAFDSWEVTFFDRASLMSAVAPEPAATSTVFGTTRAKPAARMVIPYLPGSTFATGKLNWPLSSVTTVVVRVEPSFLALTRTPSIAPSSDEETWPLSVPDVCAVAGSKPVSASTVVASNRALIRIVASLVCRLLALIARMVAFFGRPRQVLNLQKEMAGTKPGHLRLPKIWLQS